MNAFRKGYEWSHSDSHLHVFFRHFVPEYLFHFFKCPVLILSEMLPLLQMFFNWQNFFTSPQAAMLLVSGLPGTAANQ